MVYMFRQLDVYGVSVPSTVAVAAVTEGVNDESLKVIAQASNNWVNHHDMIIYPSRLSPDTLHYELSKIFERRYKILESIEASLNLSGKYYIKSKMVLGWHSSVRGSNFPWDPQKYSRIAARKSKGKANTSYPELDFTPLLQPGDSDLQKRLVDEIVEALNYINKFEKALNSIDIRLTAQFGEIEKEWFDTTNKYKQDLDRRYPYECPFCGIRKWVERGVRVPLSCGAECKLKYKPQWEEKNRSRRTSNPDGWVLAFYGTRKLCKGAKCDDGENEFGRLRQVNAESLCRECFTEGHARQRF
jgi:hypothetical protein